MSDEDAAYAQGFLDGCDSLRPEVARLESRLASHEITVAALANAGARVAALERERDLWKARALGAEADKTYSDLKQERTDSIKAEGKAHAKVIILSARVAALTAALREIKQEYETNGRWMSEEWLTQKIDAALDAAREA